MTDKPNWDIVYAALHAVEDDRNLIIRIMGDLRGEILDEVVGRLAESSTHDGCVGCRGGMEYARMVVHEMKQEEQ